MLGFWGQFALNVDVCEFASIMTRLKFPRCDQLSISYLAIAILFADVVRDGRTREDRKKGFCADISVSLKVLDDFDYA